MPTKPSVTTAQLTRTIRALQGAGVQVRGARVYPDGSVSLLTEADPMPLAKEGADWIDFCGEQSDLPPSRRKKE